MEIRLLSAMAKGSLTVRLTSRAGAKAGHSDPTTRYGTVVAQRIKATPGITGLSCPRVHIDGKVWHLNIWGEPVEIPSKESAYNGGALPISSWRWRVIPWEVCRK